MAMNRGQWQFAIIFEDAKLTKRVRVKPNLHLFYTTSIFVIATYADSSRIEPNSMDNFGYLESRQPLFACEQPCDFAIWHISELREYPSENVIRDRPSEDKG